ncbi:hypothetical protein B0H19DRAFT_947312 [Mycena capillaripes]|nr:hypothetical protein B0H19DRAFT_947312 [Mycena capillaripes]
MNDIYKDDPDEEWARLDRETFLDEVVRADGRGDYLHQTVCAAEGCKSVDIAFRCMDCMAPCLYCEACMAELHQRMPLHHIEWWNGKYFKRTSLKKLGVRIQLGHVFGDKCSNPARSHGDDFVIIGSHTIDEVGLDYCNCGKAQPRTIQLLRMRLYPATETSPRTAVTFAALDRFEHMALESKCSGYEFYNSLARETDNTGLQPSRERYDAFLRMTRQWQHLMLLKRAGRAHEPDLTKERIKGTKAGECALLCPACPQPGKNLPPNWNKVPFEKAFIYGLFLALDANFRLKRKDVSSEKKDPGLVRGWAFFGEVTAYMEHLEKYWDQKQERSTCVAHDAVDKPDRESLGTVSSGIGTVDCARHNMKRPNGVGDLQKGERYLNMDYLLFMSLADNPVLHLYISYDIACQWYKNIWERMKVFAEYKGVQFREGQKYVVFLVPKFHLPAHIELCNLLFSFNLTPFVGRTDGEAPERGWSDANRLANSTSISGPGARRDTLDVHFQYWNWKKITSLGTTLLERLQKYVPLMLDTRAAWVDFEATFEEKVIQTWMVMAVTWEKDPKKPNPFQATVKHENLQEVRRKLAVIASEDVALERVRGDMHETEMLAMGLQLEAEQRALATHVKHVGAHETVDQGRRRIERETKLRRKIDAWMSVQELFIPEVKLLRERDDDARKRAAVTQVVPGLRAQDMKLWLPSAIGTRAQCDESLRDYEYQLRKGQAFQALDEMRNVLILRTREYHRKDARHHGVKAKTRAQTRVKGWQARIDEAAATYRAARSALAALGVALKRKEWELHLKPLREEDVRGRPNPHFADEDRQREEKLPLSWIWRVQEGGAAGCCSSDTDRWTVLRIEWAKTRAKAMRYAEEVDLLDEEMRRVLQFLDWRTGWWRSLIGLRSTVQPEAGLQDGHKAYAEKQGAYMEGLAERFRGLWKDVGAFIALAREEYATMQPDDDGADSGGDEEGEPQESGWLSA